jgi:hypothetical protein
MALDRFVYFKEKDFPSLETLKTFLTAFFGEANPTKWDEATGRFYVTLPGKGSHYNPNRLVNTQRWIEVFRHSEVDERGYYSIDVITRESDPFTSILAFGLVYYLCLEFDGLADGSTDYPTPPILEPEEDD